jgi:hypothetical protein
MVATAVAGAVAAAMTMTLVTQQRFYSSAGAVLDVRSQLRDAADVLATDIRGAAVATFGLPLMTDTAIEMYTVVATSVTCAPPAGSAVGLPPVSLASDATLTSILAAPDTGDLALIYGIPSGVPDSGRWETHRILSFTSRALSTSCPSSTGFTSAADASSGATGYVVTLATTPSSAVRQGAPIHFLRRARYSLYKSSDGAWYLGYRRCNVSGPPSCAGIQPVSGPYSAYRVNGTAAGLSFRYYDGEGAEVSGAELAKTVARVEIVLRGETASAASLAGDARSVWRDSAVVTISPRNRSR